ELYEKEKLSQDKKRKELEEFIARNKARASTAALAQSKVKQLEKMDTMKDLGFDANLEFNFSYKETPTKVMLDVKKLAFGYNPDKILFDNIAFTLERGKCIAIIGKNGKGKSTLLKLLAHEMKANSGSVTQHDKVKVGYFGQMNIDRLSPRLSVCEEIQTASPGAPIGTVRRTCANVMFSGDLAHKKISVLSGGEKSRVMLGKILLQPVNLLFLDEPTNHLDMESAEALMNAVKGFDGAVVMVTHDEFFLKKIANKLIVYDEGRVFMYDNEYKTFLKKVGWKDV
ncbi:MAG: ABC-F family ATP-binding cassette domain-containing protein, partial [Rickettsiales bacterium]|nr:ABC-F family ATP-binding cassette domain-containing protein [Rickettsiales bacterium]